MKLSTKIVEVTWDEEEGKWWIGLENQISGEKSEDWCHVLVNGSGILNNWKWPDIEGLHDFKGSLMHSAKWDHGVSFEGKTVGSWRHQRLDGGIRPPSAYRQRERKRKGDETGGDKEVVKDLVSSWRCILHSFIVASHVPLVTPGRSG